MKKVFLIVIVSVLAIGAFLIINQPQKIQKVKSKELTYKFGTSECFSTYEQAQSYAASATQIIGRQPGVSNVTSKIRYSPGAQGYGDTWCADISWSQWLPI